jgi:hypothetical protein
MGDLEEDQYMDLAAAGADDLEAAAPMAARSRCRRPAAGMRRTKDPNIRTLDPEAS